METAVKALADRVHSLAIHLLRRVRAADVESELSASRLSALSVLVYGGGRTVGELARAEQVKAPTMSRLVTVMEHAGFVEREPDPEDGRRVRVVATEAGVATLESARRRRVERLSEMLGGLEPERRAPVLEAVEILEELLKRRPGDPSPR